MSITVETCRSPFLGSRVTCKIALRGTKALSPKYQLRLCVLPLLRSARGPAPFGASALISVSPEFSRSGDQRESRSLLTLCCEVNIDMHSPVCVVSRFFRVFRKILYSFICTPSGDMISRASPFKSLVRELLKYNCLKPTL